jgi:hypothetical protein
MRALPAIIARLLLPALLFSWILGCSSATRPTTTSANPDTAKPTDSPSPHQPGKTTSGGGAHRDVRARAEDELGESEAQWFNQLKTGAILYDVPPQMTLGQPSAVSVTITGYQAPAPQAASPGAEVAPLKVSNFMRVILSQDDNPDEFTVAHGQNPDEQFVPINGSATWSWTVTPKHIGKNLKLKLQAFVIYSDPGKGIQQSFPAASKQVTVVTEGLHGIADNARDSFWSDPSVWIKYMLPGGAGFAALAAVIGWWVKRKKPDAAKGAPKD